MSPMRTMAGVVLGVWLAGCGAPITSAEEKLSVGDPQPVAEAGAEASTGSDAGVAPETSAEEAGGDAADAADPALPDGATEAASDAAVAAIGSPCTSISDCPVGAECDDIPLLKNGVVYPGTCGPYVATECAPDADAGGGYTCSEGLICIEATAPNGSGFLCVLPPRTGGPTGAACDSNSDCAAPHYCQGSESGPAGSLISKRCSS